MEAVQPLDRPQAGDDMTFDGLSLLAWIAGLAFLYLCYRTAVWIDTATVLTEDHPENMRRADRACGVPEFLADAS